MSSRLQHVEIDLANVANEDALHRLLMQRLQFPDYYGKNWNAFWDVITEPDGLPHTLTLRGWAEFQHRLPAVAEQLRECLQDAGIKYSYVDCQIEYA
jgi:ribonuclease inhibitor